MTIKSLSIACILLSMLSPIANAQDYPLYIGAGNIDNVTITASDEAAELSIENIINGSGFDAEMMESARFLSQASFGANRELVEYVNDIGFEAWLDEQYNVPQSEFLTQLNEDWDYLYNGYISAGYTEDEIFGPWALNFNYTWFDHMVTGEDQLRQRMAYALSQILVVSNQSDLSDLGRGMANYYDILMNHSLGNYEDLLNDVSTSIMMGVYLSHLNNPKEIPELNIHPDENYAREIMQLFTIGLYELQPNGQHKLDAEGNSIPTYDNDDIKELARVFTGFGPGDINEYVDWVDEPYFGLDIWGADELVPMMMFDEYHDQGEKVLLGGRHTIAANQTGIEDVEEAISVLFNHENVGPFLAYRLIQRLVKSNPSPDYVQRVAAVFDDNGSGERGDLFAVAKAILLDTEARSCEAMNDPTNGKLKEPILALSQFCRSIPMYTADGNFWFNGFAMLRSTGQFPLSAPSVFNFYTPTDAPNGDISQQGLVAPEFKLFNTLSSVDYLNLMHVGTFWEYFLDDWEDDDVFGQNYIKVDSIYINEIMENDGKEAFVNELDILLTHGKMTDSWRTVIRESIEDLNWEDPADAYMILFLTLISPDYMIDK